MLKSILLFSIICIISTTANAATDIIHPHGYIGTTSFDVNDKKFDLRNANGECKYLFNDVHFHPLNFVMQGKTLKENIPFIEENCIKNSLVSSLPLLKAWQEGYDERPTYYADDDSKLYWNNMADMPLFQQWEELSEADKAKYHFLINGFNHTDKNAINYVRTITKLFPNIPVVGIGEIMGKHDKLSDQTYGGTSRADHPALDEIYKLAAKNDWFILLHNNIGNQVFGQKASRLNYLTQINNALTKHRKTTFILAHGGVSRNIVIPNLTNLLGELLIKHNNLYIDISWVIFENYIVPEGKVEVEWIDFINEYPDRILIGTDNVGGYKKDDYNVKKYILLLNALKENTAKKISYQNYDRLVKKALNP